MITIKNSNGQICDYIPNIDVDINEEIENVSKLIEICKQKLIETTGIPKNTFINQNGGK